MADIPDDAGARLAVLEQIAKATQETLGGIRADLRELRTEVHDLRSEMHQGLADLRTELRGEMHELRTETRADVKRLNERLGGIETAVARLNGQVSQLPNMWQMLTAVSLGPAVVVGVVLIIVRFLFPH